jgi:hypothetical protein
MYELNEAVRPLYHAVLLQRIDFEPERIRRYFHMSPYSTQRKAKMKRAGLKFVVPAAPNATKPEAPAEQPATPPRPQA